MQTTIPSPTNQYEIDVFFLFSPQDTYPGNTNNTPTSNNKYQLN